MCATTTTGRTVDTCCQRESSAGLRPYQQLPIAPGARRYDGGAGPSRYRRAPQALHGRSHGKNARRTRSFATGVGLAFKGQATQRQRHLVSERDVWAHDWCLGLLRRHDRIAVYLQRPALATADCHAAASCRCRRSWRDLLPPLPVALGVPTVRSRANQQGRRSRTSNPDHSVSLGRAGRHPLRLGDLDHRQAVHDHAGAHVVLVLGVVVALDERGSRDHGMLGGWVG